MNIFKAACHLTGADSKNYLECAEFFSPFLPFCSIFCESSVFLVALIKNARRSEKKIHPEVYAEVELARVIRDCKMVWVSDIPEQLS